MDPLAFERKKIPFTIEIMFVFICMRGIGWLKVGKGNVVYKQQINNNVTAAVAQSVRPFASDAESWLFKSQRRQTYVVKQVVTILNGCPVSQ